jgi:hypothetical protein
MLRTVNAEYVKLDVSIVRRRHRSRRPRRADGDGDVRAPDRRLRDRRRHRRRRHTRVPTQHPRPWTYAPRGSSRVARATASADRRRHARSSTATSPSPIRSSRDVDGSNFARTRLEHVAPPAGGDPPQPGLRQLRTSHEQSELLRAVAGALRSAFRSRCTSARAEISSSITSR